MMPKPKARADIRDQIRKAITECGVTVYQLAKETGVAPGVLYRFMSGERDLRLATAAKLAAALNLKLKPL